MVVRYVLKSVLYICLHMVVIFLSSEMSIITTFRPPVHTYTFMCVCHANTHLYYRTSFHYNPALQTRSFLMLAVISNKASVPLVTRTLRVLEETLSRREDEVHLLESIAICLTSFLPLLEQVCSCG